MSNRDDLSYIKKIPTSTCESNLNMSSIVPIILQDRERSLFFFSNRKHAMKTRRCPAGQSRRAQPVRLVAPKQRPISTSLLHRSRARERKLYTHLTSGEFSSWFSDDFDYFDRWDTCWFWNRKEHWFRGKAGQVKSLRVTWFAETLSFIIFVISFSKMIHARRFEHMCLI